MTKVTKMVKDAFKLFIKNPSAQRFGLLQKSMLIYQDKIKKTKGNENNV